jgi:hypothetical protein
METCGTFRRATIPLFMHLESKRKHQITTGLQSGLRPITELEFVWGSAPCFLSPLSGITNDASKRESAMKERGDLHVLEKVGVVGFSLDTESTFCLQNTPGD